MTNEPFYKAHWREIEPDRMSAYSSGFNWDQAAEKIYAYADIQQGMTVADFGCGPGKIATEFARRVGSGGHVHALDINAEFLDLTRKNASSAGLVDRVTTHLNDGATLPLDIGSLDRISARNTIMYVDEPIATLQEFHRVLRPGGLAHAVDGDWYMMVAEPIDHDLWRSFVKAASHACKNSDMGRKLHHAFMQAGFTNVQVSVLVSPDTQGRLLGMIRNLSKYAITSGKMPQDDARGVVDQIEQALNDGTYLVASPQFVVTGVKA